LVHGLVGAFTLGYGLPGAMFSTQAAYVTEMLNP